MKTPTFFQAIDDKGSIVKRCTFEEWLVQAKAAFLVALGAERYAYEALHAFYPEGNPDAIVARWRDGTSPAFYATERVRAVR